MSETFYRTGNYKVDHTQFGGLIYPSDFNTDFRGKDNIHGSPIAKRIEKDNQFDKQCRTNKESNERGKQYGK